MLKIYLRSFHQILFKSFVFLGPLGNLLTPQLIAPSFRSYYLLLPLFPLFYFQCKQSQVKIILSFSIFLMYCLFSIFFIDASFLSYEEIPIFRAAFLVIIFLFILGSINYIKDLSDLILLIKLYLFSFFISLWIGYIFYIGYYLKIFSFQQLEFFSVLTQIGYGLLRFSPGSYPNEYGTMISFCLCILSLIFLKKRIVELPFFNWWGKLFYFFSLFALFLTTTRAAFISYLVSLIYLNWRNKNLISFLFKGIVCFVSLFYIFLFFNINMLKILDAAISLKNFESGSLAERFWCWAKAKEQLPDHLWMGSGFSTYTYLHNLYFQLLCELGIIGCFTLCLGFFLLLLEKGYWVFKRKQVLDPQRDFISEVVKIGLFHVVWFGMSNHNLNHHLTWFVFLLYFALRKINRQISQKIEQSVSYI